MSSVPIIIQEIISLMKSGKDVPPNEDNVSSICMLLDYSYQDESTILLEMLAAWNSNNSVASDKKYVEVLNDCLPRLLIEYN